MVHSAIVRILSARRKKEYHASRTKKVVEKIVGRGMLIARKYSYARYVWGKRERHRNEGRREGKGREEGESDIS